MTVLQGMLLGFIQGVTEFLPVSSSGHLAVAQMAMGLSNGLAFDVLLHVATLAAIIWFFRQSLAAFTLRQWLFLCVASVPVVIGGLLFGDFVEQAVTMPIVVMFAFLVTAGLNFFGQWCLWRTTSINDSGNRTAAMDSPKRKLFAVGVAQVVALVPGISRSGTTVAAGLGVGLSRQAAFQWAFLLAIPAIIAAMGYEGWKVITNSEPMPALVPTVFGMATAFIIGLGSLRLLQLVMQKAVLWYFGVYCLILAGAVYILGVR